MTLDNLTVGDRVKIIGFESSHAAYRRRLLTMGLTVGTEFTLTRIAPLGDPIEISVRGYSLILRKKEASILQLEKMTS